ncbi:MAG: UDP-3-O-(3-hydroxymyristoyl)glucosamine N-acyltransferase [Pyrinomonadaceae bacterium]|nr:UDP-3-O-(3-hydroxymyristoyl)glucosamine N-acyltransferase [Pyrinomonadaceae bacterium]
MKTFEIAALVGGNLVGNGELEITHGADLADACSLSLAFSVGDASVETDAGCVLAKAGSAVAAPAVIYVDDPRLAFSIVCEILHPPKRLDPAIHPTAVISPTVKIGDGVFIGAHVTIGEGSVIGDDCQIRPGSQIGDNVTIGSGSILSSNVIIGDGCTLGSNVVLHAGVVIGTDGFGFARDKDRYVKFPQIGTVMIEDDVEIGANTCIDRGALGETRIGEGTKIDNLVQIAHNVKIGKRVVIAGQSGIAGSSVIEDDVVIAGQVGISDHVTIKQGAVIGAKSAVFPNKIVRPGFWTGIPVQRSADYLKQAALLRNLEELRSEIARLRRSGQS